MPVLFQTTIEPNQSGGWQIRLVDTLEQEEVICNSVDEYADNIERMGMEYGGDIEVSWLKDENITSTQFMEIERDMKRYQDEMENSK
jgi:hypothetical protein